MEIRQVVHPRSDMPKQGLTGFIYSMNSLVPTPIVGSYDHGETIVVHGYETKRGPGKDDYLGHTISLVELIEKEEDKKAISEMLRGRGFKQSIEFW
jgi:hypothetical protein